MRKPTSILIENAGLLLAAVAFVVCQSVTVVVDIGRCLIHPFRGKK